MERGLTRGRVLEAECWLIDAAEMWRTGERAYVAIRSVLWRSREADMSIGAPPDFSTMPEESQPILAEIQRVFGFIPPALGAVAQDTASLRRLVDHANRIC